MRDKKKNENYFAAFIERCENEIKMFQDWINDGEVAPERVPAIKRTMYQVKRNLWLARYSLGEPIDDLLAPYEEMTNDFIDNFVPEWYEDSLRLLSLGVLLDSDIETFKSLVAKIQANGNKDWLCNYIINYRLPEVVYKPYKVLWSKTYMALRQITEDSKKKPEDMLKYLTKSWYKSHKDSPWYDRHKKEKDELFDPEHSTYCGYWSFESGAVAKILGFDDSILNDAPYYPYDLVHFN